MRPRSACCCLSLAILLAGCAGTPPPPPPSAACAAFLATLDEHDVGRYRPVKRVAPHYPHAERINRIDGCAVVRFWLGPAGEVVQAEVLHASREPFAKACLEVADKWEFVPPRVGEPVTTVVNIGFDPSGFTD